VRLEASMIALIKGKLIKQSSDSVVIETSCGVGYEIFIDRISAAKLPLLNNELSLHIQTVMSENAIHLFGFLDEFTRDIFNLLTSISKIGPKTAMQILSGISASELLKAVKDENTGRLAMIYGVGRKTAERIVVELKDKCRQFELAETPEEKAQAGGLDEVRSALKNLGFRISEIETVLSELVVKTEQGEILPFEDLFRLALKKLKG
jgi:Holliday junction DNA helicase RuvA